MRREVKYGRFITLVTFAKRNGNKERSHVKYTVNFNGKQRKSVANVVADLAGAHRARARLPYPQERSHVKYTVAD